MATPIPVQLGKHSYTTRSRRTNIQRLLNLYPEANPEGSESPVTLYGTPGLKLWATVGVGPIRGIHLMGNLLYVVSGEDLYTIDTHKSSTLIGGIEGSGNVHMDESGDHVLIATSGRAYAVNQSSIFVLQEGNFTGVTYQDGYGIFPRKSSQDFFVTNLDDMTQIDALDVSQADSDSDRNIGIISNHRELWIFKNRTIEIFQNVGNPDFPFTRAGAGFIERGCYAPGSIAEEDRSVFWLGDDWAVYRSQGYQPVRISTPAVELLISNQGDQEAAWAFTYRQEGHVFYVLSFFSLTLSYDVTTGRWHERETITKGRWSGSRHSFAFAKNLVGDFENGNIYELDLDEYQDDSSTIIRSTVSQALFNKGSRFAVHEYTVELESGVGLATGQGSDPMAMLDWTDDFGALWSNEIRSPIGVSGDQSARVRFNRLGSSRHRFMRVQISDPVKVAITGSFARMSGLSA